MRLSASHKEYLSPWRVLVLLLDIRRFKNWAHEIRSWKYLSILIPILPVFPPSTECSQSWIPFVCVCSVMSDSLQLHGLYVAHQVTLSMWFSRQGFRSGLHQYLSYYLYLHLLTISVRTPVPSENLQHHTRYFHCFYILNGNTYISLQCIWRGLLGSLSLLYFPISNQIFCLP